MRALLLHRDRLDFDDGAVVELVILQVPQPVAGSRHRYKYRLYYGRAGTRVIAYDNERGKGDHCHRQGREEPYRFTTVDQLLADFLNDVAEVRKR